MSCEGCCRTAVRSAIANIQVLPMIAFAPLVLPLSAAVTLKTSRSRVQDPPRQTRLGGPIRLSHDLHQTNAGQRGANGSRDPHHIGRQVIWAAQTGSGRFICNYLRCDGILGSIAFRNVRSPAISTEISCKKANCSGPINPNPHATRSVSDDAKVKTIARRCAGQDVPQVAPEHHR